MAVARPRQRSSSPAMAPGPVSSLIMASWRPLIGPEPQYWPLIGQPLVTITQSADMSLTAGGECTSCCDKNIESLNSLCATRLRTRVMCSRGISLKRFITFVVFLVWCLALLLQSEFWSFLLCSLNYVDLYFSFMAQTASFL